MKIIYSMRIMLGLVERGFCPVQTIPNPKNSKYNCWLFEQSPDFQKNLDELMEGTA